MNDEDLTLLLARAKEGDDAARERVASALYDELRELARRHFARESVSHTLQGTALVHEAWLRLIDQDRIEWQNRAHFLAMASVVMRRVLVDHARGAKSEKRGGGAERIGITLAEPLPLRQGVDTIDLIALDEALEKLSKDHPEHARIVEMRFFSGMTMAEIAAATDVTERTVERRWRFARAWLLQALDGPEQDSP